MGCRVVGDPRNSLPSLCCKLSEFFVGKLFETPLALDAGVFTTTVFFGVKDAEEILIISGEVDVFQDSDFTIVKRIDWGAKPNFQTATTRKSDCALLAGFSMVL